jgi:ribosomal protein S18 acetylase RimI-like enzyme
MNFITVDSSRENEAVGILSDAFHDDPVMNWIGGSPDAIRPFFEITLQPFFAHDLTYLDPASRGAAAWLGPGQKLKWSYSLANFAKVLKVAGVKGIYRMIRSGMATEKHHPGSPHYYLFAIGATQEHRGKGIGSALIRHILKQCDDEGMPAYLENSKEQNLKFYEGHGFKVMKQIRFAKDAPPVWLMWREPRTTEA